MYSDINIAVDAIESAAEFLQKKSKGDILIESESGKDIKLKLDIETEKVIIKNLKSASAYNILSEEKGFINGAKNTEYTWIIDPIDGSMNFSRSIPFYCISIGLWKNDKPVLGVVYDIPHGRIYKGIVDSGASCNNVPISVSKISEKSKAVIATGFPVYSSFEDQSILNFIDKVKGYKKVRLLGSAALSIIMIAAGSIEVYEENNIAIWDVAGAVPIAIAAGAKFEAAQGKSEYLFNVKVSNGFVHDNR